MLDSGLVLYDRVAQRIEHLSNERVDAGSSPATHSYEGPAEAGPFLSEPRMKIKRLKAIPRAQFEPVLQREWRPIELVGDAVPDFARAIPRDAGLRFLASGEANAAEFYRSPRIASGTRVGGIDIYRPSPDDPVRFNKDWYAVIASPADPDTLFVDGPIRDDEHWLDEVPRRYEGIEILGGNSKKTEE